MFRDDPMPLLQANMLIDYTRTFKPRLHALLRDTSLSDMDLEIHYLGVDVTSIKTDSPRNCLLLDDRSKEAFCDYLWTLVPTETANKYRVVDTTCTAAPDSMSGSRMRRDGDHVTFVDHSAEYPAVTSGLWYYINAVQTAILGWVSGSSPTPGSDTADPNPEPVPLPSRDALLVHAAYTSFLHLSGMRPFPENFRSGSMV
ncbi:hypothetical protein L227DRAFT_610330 [Lentinus tigrinus ALCF2SS1-6]|uniref:HNH nuclease domain-containing protein n=1 Tax=Lentinus tigrinus ALCF2SS1-6 TaxID=1328759 RepID=A0A5C2SDF2_9APHY|nr:hypothetical protein L227DRAFT_610330 [Lentinus tigrinus ALCF2SS1-6]